jgi:ribosome-binding protein aMBF1 (putative translation factor)
MRNMTEIVIERTGYDIGAAIKRAKGRPEYHQETILLEVARRISNAMEKQNVSHAELARKLNVSPVYITKVLRGCENFSLQTLAGIAFALGKRAGKK